jgi:hypothetical protein
MASLVGNVVRFGGLPRRDPHAPRRRKRRSLAQAAGLSDTPPLIYTLQTILC